MVISREAWRLWRPNSPEPTGFGPAHIPLELPPGPRWQMSISDVSYVVCKQEWALVSQEGRSGAQGSINLFTATSGLWVELAVGKQPVWSAV